MDNRRRVRLEDSRTTPADYTASGKACWLVRPRFVAPLIDVPADWVQAYEVACARLKRPMAVGNHLWIYATREEAEAAKRALETAQGPLLTGVDVASCFLHQEPPEEFDDVTYEGYYITIESRTK